MLCPEIVKNNISCIALLLEKLFKLFQKLFILLFQELINCNFCWWIYIYALSSLGWKKNTSLFADLMMTLFSLCKEDTQAEKQKVTNAKNHDEQDWVSVYILYRLHSQSPPLAYPKETKKRSYNRTCCYLSLYNIYYTLWNCVVAKMYLWATNL